jgi:hypothetical protein
VARYDAFLLRIWRSGTGTEDGQWAIRLEHLPDGHGLRFSDLDALIAHLRTLLHQGGAPPAGPRAEPD